jgi:hypothetical protein
LYTAFSDGKFAGGDSILFRRGDRWKPEKRGYLRVRNIRDASQDNPLRIGAYGIGTSRPAIDAKSDTGFYIITCNGEDDQGTEHVVLSDLKIAGNLAVHIHLRSCVDWRVENCVTDGRGNGIAINGASRDVVIEACEIIGGKEGIYIGKADGSDNPTRISILRCRVHSGINDGIDFKSGCRDCRAVSNVVYDRDENGISCRGKNILVAGNEVYDCRGAGYGIAQFDKAGDGVTIEHNVIYAISADPGRAANGISVSGKNSIVLGNQIGGCDRGVLVAHGASILRRNTLQDCKYGVFVRSGAPRPTLEYNTFEDCRTDVYPGG